MTPPNKPSRSLSTQHSALSTKKSTKRAEQTSAFLDELFPLAPGEREISGLKIVPIDKVHPRSGQPRGFFDRARLSEMANDIRGLRERKGGVGETGIIQPLLVSQDADGTYTLIAGERRWRAAQEAENTEVPIVVRDQNNDEAFEDAIRENIQREDLTVAEETAALISVMERNKLSVRQAAERFGKDRGWVNNRIRFNKAGEDIKTMVSLVAQTDPTRKVLSHAMLIQDVADPKLRSKLIREVVSDRLSFAALQQMVESSRPAPPDDPSRDSNGADTVSTRDSALSTQHSGPKAKPPSAWPNPQTEIIRPVISQLAQAEKLYLAHPAEKVQKPEKLAEDRDLIIEFATRVYEAGMAVANPESTTRNAPDGRRAKPADSKVTPKKGGGRK